MSMKLAAPMIADGGNKEVLSVDFVQEGATVGTSEPIIDLFGKDNYSMSDATNINELYNKMSQSDYEQFLVHINFTEPYFLRDAVIGKVEDGGIGILNDESGKTPGDIEILDLGCGTGIVGHLIKDAGFTNIFGLDASSGFIDMINSKCVYKGGEVRFLGQGVDAFPDKYKNRFDLVTGTGIFLAKHAPAPAFEDAHAALKVGGIFVFTLRSNLWVDGHELGYKDTIERLVKEGKMEYLDHVSKDFWRGREKGIGLFERQESKIFALRKLA